MTLGRTPAGAIKTKTDGGLRAVECACCGPCGNLPPVCLDGVSGSSWRSGDPDNSCYADFQIPGCQDSAFIAAGEWWRVLCGGFGGIGFVFVLSNCFGAEGTWFLCKSDGIDSPIGSYSGVVFPGGYLNITITERLNDSC